jgi:S1-C subfamily serine protease
VTTADWVALAVVAASAFVGYARGFLASVLSAAGIVTGAIVGARVGPHLLAGGSRSPYTPLAALVGAAFFAILLEAAGTLAGTFIRRALGPLRAVDSLGGIAAGAAGGVVVVWMLGAVALLLPGQTQLRETAQRSLLLHRLDELVPPRRLLNLLARVDPFPTIAGPGAGVAAPDPTLPSLPGVRRAQGSVVRVLGTACGVGVSGSGWVARRGLVVTAAHVVAGQHDTTVELPGSSRPLAARAVGFDAHDDLAVLSVPELRGARPLAIAEPRVGAAVAILGYPEDGPLTATAGRIGHTGVVLTQDAYGRGPVSREITSVRGVVRHGNSGGPAVDARGAVESTVFAARIGSDSGFGIPAAVVRRDLARATRPVSTGPCAA